MIMPRSRYMKMSMSRWKELKGFEAKVKAIEVLINIGIDSSDKVEAIKAVLKVLDKEEN